MSFGKNKSSQTQQSQSTATQALDPQIKDALLKNYGDFNTNVPGYTPYSGTTVAGFTPQQERSFGLVGDIANNQTGAAPLSEGIATTGGVAGFAPSTVGPNGVDPASISKFMSPYIGSVVNTTQAAADNALGQTLNRNASDATKAGAWRGNALGVQNALDESQSNIGVASTIANLTNQGYGIASGLATSDAERAQAAERANQGAGIAGAGIRLTAGQNLAAMGGQQLSDAATRASLVNQAGGQQQAQRQAELQWQYENGYLNPQQYALGLQQLRNQTLGLAGNPVLGSSQSTGSGSGKSSGFNITLPTPH